MKIFKFISFIITGTLSVLGLVYCYKLTLNMDTTGLGIIALIVKSPLLFILGLITTGLLISTLFSSLFSISSPLMPIKVFAIIFLILSLTGIAFEIDILNNLFHFMS